MKSAIAFLAVLCAGISIVSTITDETKQYARECLEFREGWYGPKGKVRFELSCSGYFPDKVALHTWVDINKCIWMKTKIIDMTIDGKFFINTARARDLVKPQKADEIVIIYSSIDNILAGKVEDHITMAIEMHDLLTSVFKDFYTGYCKDLAEAISWT